MKTSLTHFAAGCAALVLGLAGQASAAGAQIGGALTCVDVRYPTSLPNDFEIVLYGDGLTAASVIDTWDSSVLIGGTALGWGKALSVTVGVGNDPLSPGFGLECVTVRWAGPPRPSLVGQLLQLGVRLRVGAAVAHQECWWTINGQRVLQPEAVHVIWHATGNGWLIELENPSTSPIYVYGARFFSPVAGQPLPTLAQFSTAMNPVTFGAAGWTNLALPGVVQGVREILPRTHLFLRVASVPLRPIVLQIAARNARGDPLPLFPGTTGPQPDDWNGEQGTMSILTTRATQELLEDLNGDGIVGIPDFNLLRARFGTASADQ